MNLHQHAKNQFLPFVHSSDRVNYRVPSHDWPHPLLTTPTPKIFKVLLTCMNLYHHAKNQLVLEIQSTLESGDHIYYIYYGEIEIYYISFRNYAIWLAEIWNKIFPKYRICTGTQQIINKFIIEQIQWELMIKFFFKLKKPIFGLFLPKNQVVMHNFLTVSFTLTKSRGRTDGRMDRPYFIGPLQLTPEVQKLYDGNFWL